MGDAKIISFIAIDQALNRHVMMNCKGQFVNLFFDWIGGKDQFVTAFSKLVSLVIVNDSGASADSARMVRDPYFFWVRKTPLITTIPAKI